MGDIVGRLFREFAVTLAVTILVSAVVSLTLTPMMCAKLLKHKPQSQQGWFYRVSEHVFERVIAFLWRTLQVVLRHQPHHTARHRRHSGGDPDSLLYVPKGFFPVQDTGVILGISEAPQTISFPAHGRSGSRHWRGHSEDPDVDSLSSFIGVDGTNTTPQQRPHSDQS